MDVQDILDLPWDTLSFSRLVSYNAPQDLETEEEMIRFLCEDFYLECHISYGADREMLVCITIHQADMLYEFCFEDGYIDTVDRIKMGEYDEVGMRPLMIDDGRPQRRAISGEEPLRYVETLKRYGTDCPDPNLLCVDRYDIDKLRYDVDLSDMLKVVLQWVERTDPDVH